MESFTCTNCQADLGGLDDRVASKNERVMGDDVYISYWECAACGCFTSEYYRDSFTTGTHRTVSGPFSPEKGRKLIKELKR